MTFYYFQVLVLKWHDFLDKFVKAVGKAGLRLNVVRLTVVKMVILTNEAQPPNTLVTRDGLILKVVERNQGQKWLECILTAWARMMQHIDFAYDMEQGTEIMHEILVFRPFFWKLRSNRDKNPQFRLKDLRGSRLGSSRSASCSTALSRGPSSLQGWGGGCAKHCRAGLTQPPSVERRTKQLPYMRG